MILVIVKGHLVQIGRVDGPIENLSSILAAVQIGRAARGLAAAAPAPAQVAKRRGNDRRSGPMQPRLG